MRVMLMIKGDREPGHLPSEELMTEMAKYNEELSNAGVLVDLAALHWSAEGVRVRFSGGERTVVKGPFGDPKEIVAGYWILQVKAMDEAVEWAKRLPFENIGRLLQHVLPPLREHHVPLPEVVRVRRGLPTCGRRR